MEVERTKFVVFELTSSLRIRLSAKIKTLACLDGRSQLERIAMMRFRLHTPILVLSLVLLSVALSFADDRIWLKNVKVNGRPVRMLFDSDADGIMLTSDAINRLGLKVVDPPTNGLPAYTAVYTVDLDGYSFQTYFSVLNLPEYAASEFDGILGWWIFHSSTLRIDGESRRITFFWHAPRGARKWTSFLVMTNSGVLDLEVPHSDGTKGIVTVDTGDPRGVELSPRLWRQWKKAHPHVPMTLRASVGLNDFAIVEEAFADKIDVGPTRITDVPVLELDTNDDITITRRGNQDGILGLAALSRLDFVVDGPHNVAYLRAKTSRPAPYTYNRLGAVFVATTEHPHEGVAWVIAGSPAYDAGIRDGDILLQVDGIRPRGLSSDWLSKFELPAGTKLHFTLQRNGTNFETVATLRDILKPSSGG